MLKLTILTEISNLTFKVITLIITSYISYLSFLKIHENKYFNFQL